EGHPSGSTRSAVVGAVRAAPAAPCVLEPYGQPPPVGPSIRQQHKDAIESARRLDPEVCAGQVAPWCSMETRSLKERKSSWCSSASSLSLSPADAGNGRWSINIPVGVPTDIVGSRRVSVISQFDYSSDVVARWSRVVALLQDIRSSGMSQLHSAWTEAKEFTLFVANPAYDARRKAVHLPDFQSSLELGANFSFQRSSTGSLVSAGHRPALPRPRE
ncbi:unnamed protein product, partial [Prorocentrum cordatum]